MSYQLAHAGILHDDVSAATESDAYEVGLLETHAETSDVGVLDNLGINGQLFVFQLINFAIVGAIVWFLILKPLTKKMEERRTLIDESLDKAKEVETNLAMSERKFQERVDEAKVESNRMIAKATEEAMAVSGDMKKKAKEEIELLVKQAKKNIEIDREDMRTEIRKETASMIVAALKKILQQDLDPKMDAKYIETILKNKE